MFSKFGIRFLYSNFLPDFSICKIIKTVNPHLSEEYNCNYHSAANLFFHFLLNLKFEHSIKIKV